jgi:polyisoprenoid-binding protein YceI
MTTHDTQSRVTNPAGSVVTPLVPGRWRVDPMHSSIVFSIRHLGLSRVRGRFGRFDASLDVGGSLDETRVEATVYTASVDTNQAERDEHLRSADFLDVAEHPEMRFTSTRITGAGHAWRMDGELTILGRTWPFGFDVEFYGIEDFDVDNTHRAGFGARGELKRSEFGLDFGLPAAKGLLLGDAVTFELDVQFIEPAAS